jgi:dTDP-4-amino-4,6-dideoxygalactose transaminase
MVTHTRPDVAVPFLDLAPATAAVKDAFLAEASDLLDTGAFTNGPQVAAFEAAFASYCESPHCVGLASGLDALRLALLALDIGPGDEVVVPANTFVATFEAVSQVGATPVPVDASLDDYNIDVEAAAAAVGPRTRALLPVHLYGQLADMHGLARAASASDVAILEDACQAHGATRAGIRAGANGRAAGFSFYPGKNLGAFGDAGALTTSDAALAERVRALREHGQRAKYHHDEPGYTARLDTIQAIALRLKLSLLDGWNAERRRVAALYAEALAGVGDLVLPPVAEGSDPVWHLYVVRSEHRDDLADFLRSAGIGTGLHYPQPAHLSPAYAFLGLPQGAFPVAERLAAQVLSLPMFPSMTDVQVEAVGERCREFFARGR